MKFHNLSSEGDRYLVSLQRFQQVKNKYVCLDFKRVNSCDLDVILINKDDLDLCRVKAADLDVNLITRLQAAWAAMPGGETGNKRAADELMQVIESCSVPLISPSYEKDFIIRRLHNDHDRTRVVLFLREGTWFPLESIFMLARVCQVDKGLIPLHVSAVKYQNNLYLFGGPSGAGKSTVAKIIIEKGGVLLDEDQVIVRKNPDGSYSANAWGYSMKTSDVPIQAIFQLIKSDRNTLFPLSPMQSTRFLMSQADQVAGRMLHNDLYRCLFRQVAEMARCIPAYQLHFTLDSQFWSLIQEEINLG